MTDKVVMKREKKQNGPLARRLDKYMTANVLKRGDKARVGKELCEAIGVKSVNHPYYWIGNDAVPQYHALALETFLTGKGY